MKRKSLLCFVVVLVLCLVAAFALGCDKKENAAQKKGEPPASVDEAISRLRAAGYRVDTYDYEDSDEETELYGLICQLLAETNGETEYLEAHFFESEERAAAYLEAFREELEEDREDDLADGENVTFGQSGKWVYYGTKGAVEVFLTSAEGKKA